MNRNENDLENRDSRELMVSKFCNTLMRDVSEKDLLQLQESESTEFPRNFLLVLQCTRNFICCSLE